MRCNVMSQLQQQDAMAANDAMVANPHSHNVKWRRILAVSAMFVALMLILGSIYLHVRQKHHLGRLRYDDGENSIPMPQMPPIQAESANESTLIDYDYKQPLELVYPVYGVPRDDPDYYEEYEYSENDLEDIHSKWRVLPTQTLSPSTPAPNQINNACMQCICYLSTKCKSGPFGTFRISKPYWLDAGELTITQTTDTLDAFESCVNNDDCAMRTVSAYIKRYARDCNHDDMVDCSDHIALHLLGPRGCLNEELRVPYEADISLCISNMFV